ncbi:hypothetical protein [Sulfurimonas sp.]|uniref:hypothetical protein n=1 Tax=Sulfurimonas sp. TaxID=2022749 RepID=UPI002AB2402B|nr:hypothetical protein [Sulfurimonas sp.]
MQNPFESGHIRNYILFYVGIVVIMILFFITATLFREAKDIEKKVFKAEKASTLTNKKKVKKEVKFKLLNKAY